MRIQDFNPVLKEDNEVADVVTAHGLVNRALTDTEARQEYFEFLQHLRNKHGKDYSTRIHQKAAALANKPVNESDEIQPDRIYPFIKSLQKFLYNDSKLKNKITPYDVGMRVWTRGDGVRMRDPARLEFNQMELRDYAFDLLKDALKGARSTQISGEFPSLPYGVGLVWKGKIIYKMGNFSIAIGSASRITNKNSVWKEKPMDEAVVDSSSNTMRGGVKNSSVPTVVNNSSGSLYMASAAYMKQQAAKYQKHVAGTDSTPAGPDTSKFSATRSGMIAFEKDVTVHGNYYGSDRFYQNFVKIGGNVDYDIKKKMEAEFREWLATATGEANYSYVTPDRYYIVVGDANGTNWGGYGLSFKKIDDDEWNKKYASLFNQSVEGVNETIVKVGSQYELKSHTGKNLGKYPTKAGAKKREQQVNYFKHVNEDAWTGDNPAWHNGNDQWNDGTDQWHSADDGAGGGAAPLTGEIPVDEDFNPTDSVTVDVPLLIRLLEYAREDAKTDMDLHDVTERLIALSQEGNTLTMQDYDTICNTKETDQ